MSVNKNSQLLSGYRIVVTGASSGIGRQVAVAVAQAGCSHLLVHGCRNQLGAEETAVLAHSFGAEVQIELCDFTERDAVESFVATAFERWQGIDAWLHFAGADVLTGAAAKWDFETKLRHLWNVDVMGAIHIGRAVGKRWRELSCDHALSRSQVIPSLVFVSWDQASEGMEGDAGQMFGSTKAAVDAFAMSLAQDLAPHARVNTVAPGWIRTAWGEHADNYWQQRAAGQSLMNGWGTPDDVAQAALFLISPAAKFITAQRLIVNGGWNRRFDRPT